MGWVLFLMLKAFLKPSWYSSGMFSRVTAGSGMRAFSCKLIILCCIIEHPFASLAVLFLIREERGPAAGPTYISSFNYKQKVVQKSFWRFAPPTKLNNVLRHFAPEMDLIFKRCTTEMPEIPLIPPEWSTPLLLILRYCFWIFPTEKRSCCEEEGIWQ